MISIKQKIMHYAWDIAYGIYNEEILGNGLSKEDFNIIKNPYKNKWFADPFILEDNDKHIQFLVEEFDYSIGRGRIARLKVEKKPHKIIEYSIILDLPTHLSFPAIYRFNNEIYVHPENSASGASYIYRYDRDVDKLIEPKLMVDEPITDAIIIKAGDTYKMFATKVPDPNGNVLHVYHSSSLLEPFKHVSTENYENNTARMAGMFIPQNGCFIRPAQDCHGGYGKAVIMYDGQKQLCRIVPHSYKYAGIHTFNTLGDTFVIDLKRYDYPLLYKLIRRIKG